MQRGCFRAFYPLRRVKASGPNFPVLVYFVHGVPWSFDRKEVYRWEWKPLKASQENIGISHFFFAVDLILFAKVEVQVCKAISKVLNRFCEELGQKR